MSRNKKLAEALEEILQELLLATKEYRLDPLELAEVADTIIRIEREIRRLNAIEEIRVARELR